MLTKFIILAILATADHAEESLHTANHDSLVGVDHIKLHVPNKAIGELMFSSLQKAQPDFLMMVESESGRKLTAKEMFLSCSKLAWAMKETYGISEMDRIAIIGGNSIDINIAGCATYFVGAVVTPISPILDERTYLKILRKVSPKLIITDANIAQFITNATDLNELTDFITVQPFLGYKTIAEIISGVSKGEAMRYRPAKIKNHQMASIVFTSGASGEPKGVAISHYALAYQASLLSRGDSGTRLHVLFYWICGLLAMIDSTINIVTRVLVINTNATGILTAIDNYKPDRSEMPPVLLDSVLRHHQVRTFNLTSMKEITLAGSRQSPCLFHKVKEFMPVCAIRRIYEITEVSGFLSEAVSPLPEDLSSIGPVIPGFQVKVLNPSTSKSVKPGGQGEIWCRGPTMMLGYVSDKNETKQVTDADGWLATGDIGRLSTRGLLLITGRYSALITVGRHKVSPEEVEGVIFQLKGVDDAVVTNVINTSNSGKENMLMALVVLNHYSSVSEEEITTLVENTLSEWKHLRAGVRFVSGLPRTPTGKIKRREVHEAAQKMYSSRMFPGEEQCYRITNTTGCLCSG